MWIKYKYKGNLCFLNLEHVEAVTLVTDDKEQYIVVEFNNSTYKIEDSENENFEEIKQKLMEL